MTVNDFMAQVGIGPKLTERYGEYPTPNHDQQVYYAYEPPGQPTYTKPVASPKHGHGGGGKGGAAMSALTLLAFLFYLHILQQCIKEQMTAMSTPQVMIMTAGREGEAEVSKHAKIDKTGTSERKDNNVENYDETDSSNGLMKVQTAEHTPKNSQQYRRVIQSHGNRSLSFPGFVNAMDDS